VQGLSAPARQLKTIVYWGAGSDASAVEALRDVSVYGWDEFMALGRQKPFEPVPPKPEDVTCIMYTSGTTGDPKVLTPFLHMSPASLTPGGHWGPQSADTLFACHLRHVHQRGHWGPHRCWHSSACSLHHVSTNLSLSHKES
jgi:acyl-coenzyme A synthetase/AMP-(fatty) acid ligase